MRLLRDGFPRAALPVAFLAAALPVWTTAADPHPDLTRLAPTEDVWIDRARREVVVGGRIALASGPIEFFACPQGTKEHESIVATQASARLVHAALLAIGLEPGSPVAFDPEYVAASGPRIAVRVRWTRADGGQQVVDAKDADPR